MLTDIQYRILKRISPGNPDIYGTSFYEGKSKIGVLMGDGFFDKIAGKVVIDFGCGEGDAAIEMAGKGAKKVVGIDIQEDVLEKARQKAPHTNVVFATTTTEPADIVVSTDAFEHFDDPGKILEIMSTLLQPSGEVLMSFGPPWYHPLGGHLFSVIPWAHILFSEKALIRWRSTFKADAATCFSEVAGGLNRMTIRRFEKLVRASPLKLASVELVPVRGLRHFHNRLTREFMTSVVRCRLVKRSVPGQ
jgi:SAM-dependent methyltransferase